MLGLFRDTSSASAFNVLIAAALGTIFSPPVLDPVLLLAAKLLHITDLAYIQEQPTAE